MLPEQRGCDEIPDSASRTAEEVGLEVEPTKTKVMEFGGDAERNARTRGGRPETSTFWDSLIIAAAPETGSDFG